MRPSGSFLLLCAGLWALGFLLFAGCGPVGSIPVIWGIVEVTSDDDEGPQPPAAPSSVTAPSNSETGSYTITWAGAATATSYDLEEDTDTAFSSPSTLYTGANTTYDVTGQPDGTYYYRVRALNPHGSSGWTEGGNGCVVYIPKYNAKAVGWVGGGTSGWKTTSGAATGVDDRSFHWPHNLYVDTSGFLYVADFYNDRVMKWDASGNIVGWIGGGSDGWKTGSGATGAADYRSFDGPVGVFVDGTGDIYVADYFNHRVCRWSAAGTASGWIGGGSNGWKITNGSTNAADYQSFYRPYNVFVDGSDLYVTDSWNHRVCRWSTAGNAVGWIGGAANGWRTSFGSSFASDYQSFATPSGIFVHPHGEIYVADWSNNRITKWSTSGNALGWIGGGFGTWQTGSGAASGSAEMDFEESRGVWLDVYKNIYVADTQNHRVVKRDPAGGFVGWIGGGSNNWKDGPGTASGSDYQSFNRPVGVFVDTGGEIYVAEHDNHRVSKWEGIEYGWIGGGQDGWQEGPAPLAGTSSGSFDSPVGPFVDPDGNTYMSDILNHRVCKWDSNGNFIGWLGGGTDGWKTGSGATAGTGYRSFDHPFGIAVASNGDIYVADGWNARVSRWSAAGTALGWIGGAQNGWQTGNAPGMASDYRSFNTAFDVCLIGGELLIVDGPNNRVCRWDTAGNAIGWIGGGSNGWKTTNGTTGASDYQSFDTPVNVRTDGSGSLYVTEMNNHRVSQWTLTGNAVGWIGGGSNGWKTTNGASTGSDYRSFNQPEGMYVTSAGVIYVTDVYNHRISKWTTAGNAIGWKGGGLDTWQTGSGTTSGQDYLWFYIPEGIFVDHQGSLVVTDTSNHRVCKLKD
jgi:hypothetical protein